MNRLHGRAGVSAEDHRYALASLVVVPVRWLDRYGRRPASAAERRASALFYHHLGAAMGVADTPSTYDGMAEHFDTVQRTRLGRTAGTWRASELTIGHIADRLPRPLRPLVRPVLAAVLDRPVASAVGLPPPPRAVRLGVELVLRSRRLVSRLLPARRSETTPRTRRGLPAAQPRDLVPPAGRRVNP
jgi:hypothetical protein